MCQVPTELYQTPESYFISDPLWFILIQRNCSVHPVPSISLYLGSREVLMHDSLRPHLPVSAGQGEAGRVPTCTLSSGSCPAMCTCSNGIVDCRGKGLTAIPANLPETMTEM